MFLTATPTMVRSMSQMQEKYSIMLPPLANCPKSSDDDMKSLLNRFAFDNNRFTLQSCVTPHPSSSLNTPRMSCCTAMELTPQPSSLPSPSLSPATVVEEVKENRITKPRAKRRSNSAPSAQWKRAPIKVVFDASGTTAQANANVYNGIASPATSPPPCGKNAPAGSSSTKNTKVLLGQMTRPNNKVYSDRSSVIKLKDNSQKIEQRRKHICQVCLTGFTTSGHLSRHLKIHTGEKSHVCPHVGCKQSFSRQDNCLQHYRTHQKKKD